jgi:hypothetical protein
MVRSAPLSPVSAQNPVGLLVGGPLPGTVRLTEVDLDPIGYGEVRLGGPWGYGPR